jgi:hypothetical protein
MLQIPTTKSSKYGVDENIGRRNDFRPKDVGPRKGPKSQIEPSLCFAINLIFNIGT